MCCFLDIDLSMFFIVVLMILAYDWLFCPFFPSFEFFFLLLVIVEMIFFFQIGVLERVFNMYMY